MMRAFSVVLLGALTVASTVSAQPANDLRDLQIGLNVSNLKTEAYDGFTCEAAPATILSGWSDFGRCRKSAVGVHAVRFRYRDDPVLGSISEDGQGTKVAGQPVLLTLLVDDGGTVAGLRIQTDPGVRLFTRRRADIFALQAMARYGDDGWTCTKASPSPHAQPIGDTFVDDRCQKTADGKVYVVNRRLFRDPDRPLKEFVSEASVSIMRAGS